MRGPGQRLWYTGVLNKGHLLRSYSFLSVCIHPHITSTQREEFQSSIAAPTLLSRFLRTWWSEGESTGCFWPPGGHGSIGRGSNEFSEFRTYSPLPYYIATTLSI